MQSLQLQLLLFEMMVRIKAQSVMSKSVSFTFCFSKK